MGTKCGRWDWRDDLRTRFAELYAIHQETGLSLAELDMRFLLADMDVATVIPGAATVAQLEENVGGAECLKACVV